MPLDPKSQEVKEWLEIAKKDLEAGKVLADNPNFSAQASFFAQQAAEKSLKAFLIWHQERFKKEHDIRYLGDLVRQKDSTFEDRIAEAVSLNPFAVTIRYPGFSEEPTAEEAKEALKIADNLYQAVLSRLPDDIRS